MRKTQFFQMEFKNLEVKEEDSKIIIEGYASTPDLDTYDDIVKPEAFKDTMMEYISKYNGQVLIQHAREKIAGKVSDYRIEDRGLWVRVELFSDIDGLFKSIQQGMIGAFSIGYRALSWTLDEVDGRLIRTITKLALVEISVVNGPANPKATFNLIKSIKSFFDGLTAIKSMTSGVYEIKSESQNDEIKEDDIQEVEEKEKKSLYVFRKVKKANELRDFAIKQGIKDVLDTKDMHVTIAFSKKEVNWDSFKKDSNEIDISLKGSKIEKLGDALVVKFESKELEESWKKYIDGGASWDFKNYNPHISLSYNTDGYEEKEESFDGEFKLGEEIFDEVKTELIDGLEKKETSKVATTDEEKDEEVADTDTTKTDDVEIGGETPPNDDTETVKSDEVKALESEIDELKETLESKDKEIKELTDSQAEMKKTLSEKEDEIKSYLQVVPETKVETKSSGVNSLSALRYPEFK